MENLFTHSIDKLLFYKSVSGDFWWAQQSKAHAPQ